MSVFLCLCASTVHAQHNQRPRGQASAQARGDKRSKPARKAKRTRAERNKHAQPTRNAAPEAALPKPEAASPEAPAPAPVTDDTKPARDGDKPAAAGAAAGAQRAESEVDPADVREEDGTQVKVMEFSGLDIEGQLKTPQMLYFLNRLRAEFGRPRLPHRSFMPELQAGTQDKAMR